MNLCLRATSSAFGKGSFVTNLRMGFIIAALAALLAGCTLTITPGDVSVSGRVRLGITVSDVIQVFEPTRGTGATYYVGENIAFRVRTSQDGYLTLSAIDPDGSVYTFARNLYVRGGQTQIFEGPDDASIFSLVPPRGFHRVRASFTPTRTSGRVTYRGVSGERGWEQSIVSEIRASPVRDVAETNFYLR